MSTLVVSGSRQHVKESSVCWQLCLIAPRELWCTSAVLLRTENNIDREHTNTHLQLTEIFPQSLHVGVQAFTRVSGWGHLHVVPVREQDE